MSQEDLLLLFKLILLKLGNVFDFTILRPDLDIFVDLSLLAHVVVFDFQQVSVQLSIDVLLALLEFLKFLGLVGA